MSRQGRLGLPENGLPILYCSCLLESWLQSCLLWPDVLHGNSRTMSGSGRGWGAGGPVHLQQREKFSLQVVSGLRLPRGASCDLGSRCWPVGTHKMLGLSVAGKNSCTC